MIQEKVGLIPRYNWDYRFPDLIQALGGIIANDVHSERTLEKIYGQKTFYLIRIQTRQHLRQNGKGGKALALQRHLSSA